MTTFLIGADPEFFVKKNGTLVSAHGLIPGTKEAPHKVKLGAVQVDGTALEFNIDPANTAEIFERNMSTVLGEIRGMVGEEYEFDFSPVANFGKEYIDSLPEKAKELGCDPDFNAYTGLPNPKPDADMGFRTASGHIHIGWTENQDVTDPDHLEACRMLTKQLDITLGVTSKIWDRDTVRSSMYGAPGAFRPKSYGVEYRVLSNAWVNDARLRRIVFDITMASAKKLVSGSQIYNSYTQKSFNGLSYVDLYSEIDYLLGRYGLISSTSRALLRSVYEEVRAKEVVPKKKMVAIKKMVVPDELDIAVNENPVPVGIERLQQMEWGRPAVGRNRWNQVEI